MTDSIASYKVPLLNRIEIFLIERLYQPLLSPIVGNSCRFTPTCSNYGIIKDGELANENYELKPLSLYAKAKVSNEKYLFKEQ